MKTRYIVRHASGMSDRAGEGFFSVRGPRINEFAVAEQLARVMQRAVNKPEFTPREWKVIRQALQAAMAGEWSAGDLNWSEADAAAANHLLEIL